jgi:cholesterol oxidase
VTPATEPFDAVIVGSGFGGAVSACRLAEAGYRVVVLERGRRWTREEFPAKSGAWIYDHLHPELANGWLDVRVFPRMAVVQGAGVGGGSLVYANISVEADPAAFDKGWPPEIDHESLAPHYATVGQVMNVQAIPEGQWPARTRLMHEAAAATGAGGRFKPLELAVSFDPSWSPDEEGAREQARSVPFTNAHGVEQGTCVHLGECDIGCPVGARNTLDLNYLAIAECHGAQIRPLHLVRSIQPAAGGYQVLADRIVDGQLEPVSVSGRIVVLAAGSLGSTELLLRCRDVLRTMPGLPRKLGAGWSANGDFLTLGIHDGRLVEPTHGPTITSAIDFRDGVDDGQAYFIEDGGFPDLLGTRLREPPAHGPRIRRRRWFMDAALGFLGRDRPFEHVMPWFAQGRDAADGRLRLRRRWWLFGPWQLELDWRPKASMRMLKAIANRHQELATATGGSAHLPPSWALAKYLVTPHPLGGCRMGSTPRDSVVDHRGEVWGHRNLFVADGAIVPAAIGANPSRTIAALAERIARYIVEGDR